MMRYLRTDGPLGWETRDERRALVARLYTDELLPTTQVAALLGIGLGTVQSDLDAAGVCRRTRVESQRLRRFGSDAAWQAFVAAAAEMAAAGHSVYIIARRLPHGEAAVRRALAEVQGEPADDDGDWCPEPREPVRRRWSYAGRLAGGGHLRVVRRGGMLDGTLVDADGSETPGLGPTVVVEILRHPAARVRAEGSHHIVTLAA